MRRNNQTSPERNSDVLTAFAVKALPAKSVKHVTPERARGAFEDAQQKESA
jgi:hypothetical protein